MPDKNGDINQPVRGDAKAAERVISIHWEL